MEVKQMFSLRKLKNGLASVAVGTALFAFNADKAQATEIEEYLPVMTEESTILPETDNVEAPVVEEVTDVVELPEEEAETVAALDQIVEVESKVDDELAPAIIEQPIIKETIIETPEPSQAKATAAKEETIEDKKAPLVDSKSTQADVPDVTRHEGSDREAVALDVASQHFSQAQKVILVNRDKYTDAISATNISQGESPVLYTRTNRIGDKTVDFMKSMKNLNEIYLLGGTDSIDQSVENTLNSEFGNIITRIKGHDRFEANANAIREKYTKADHVVIATGEIFTDALYGVSYANTVDAPIVISKTERLVKESLDLLKELGTSQVTIIGGENSVAKDVENQLKDLNITVNPRIAGKNRYDGSVEVAKQAYNNPDTILIASGEGFSDALVSAPLAQKLNAPILLVQTNDMRQEVQDYLNDNAESIKTIYIQGGTNTISKKNEDNLKKQVTYPVLKEEIVDAKENKPEVIQKVETKVVKDTVNMTPQQFLNYLSDYAVEIANENDLYASVMLAQAALESGWGKSSLSRAPNYNLFGIKGSYNGQAAYVPTLEDDGTGRYYQIMDSFRRYPSQKESLEDYANKLRYGTTWNPLYYSGAWKSKASSYQSATAWLTGRYATDTRYASKLNSIISTYNLTQYDTPRSASTPKPSTVQASRSYTVKAGDGLWKIATNHGISLSQLKALNGLTSDIIHPGQTLKV